MRDEQVGAAIRAVRQRRGWRQADLAERAGVGQSLVSLAERGRLERLSVRSVRSISAALDIAMPFAPRWRGGELDRLLDQAHAAIVEEVVRILRRDAWAVLVEYGFNHYGDRGSVDVLAWHEARRILLLVEVKSRLFDLQATMSSSARKERVVPARLADERGWRARVVASILVMPDTRSNRRSVEQHAATFEAAFPAGSRAVRRWLTNPDGPIRGRWFLSISNEVAAGRRRQRIPSHRRVRLTTQRPTASGDDSHFVRPRARPPAATAG